MTEQDAEQLLEHIKYQINANNIHMRSYGHDAYLSGANDALRELAVAFNIATYEELK